MAYFKTHRTRKIVDNRRLYLEDYEYEPDENDDYDLEVDEDDDYDLEVKND